MQKIVLQYLPLVKKIAKMIYIKNKQYVEYEDLINYGVLGLINGVNNLDKDRRTRPQTYLYIKIYGYIIDQLRKMKQFNIIYLENLTDYDQLLYDDYVERQMINTLLSTELLTILINSLNDQEKKVIVLYFYENLNQEEIASILNLTKSRISQIYIRSLNKIRRYVEQNNIEL